MKHPLCILLLITVSATLYSKTVSEDEVNKNEYNGKTITVTYEDGDEDYKDGVAREVEYYNGNNKLKKKLITYNDEFTTKNGYQRKEVLFSETGITSKETLTFSESFYHTKGYYMVVMVYNNYRKVTRKTFYFTDDFAATEGFYRAEIIYNDFQKPKTTVYYDKNGKEKNRENY